MDKLHSGQTLSKRRQIYLQIRLRDDLGTLFMKWNLQHTKQLPVPMETMINVPKFTKINTAGELAYLWKYQINHM
jgi:hypothetical protein